VGDVRSRHPAQLSHHGRFGIHTFRLINAEGKATFVRFHWKPVAGKASLVWDESQKLTGRDPDFHRRDLWEAIEAGDYPEYELGLQLIPEEDEFAFDFDLLDPTKLIPKRWCRCKGRENGAQPQPG
jgi:catalase